MIVSFESVNFRRANPVSNLLDDALPGLKVFTCEKALDQWTLYDRTCSCVQTCKWRNLCTLVWREEPEKCYCMKIYGLLQANSLHVYPFHLFCFLPFALCKYKYFYWFNEYFWLSWFKNRVYSEIMRWELTGFKTDHVNSHNNLCPTISQTSNLSHICQPQDNEAGHWC